jgi:tetratricopeptide (TPR) repeat protein
MLPASPRWAVAEHRDEDRGRATDGGAGPESLGPTVRSPRVTDETFDLPPAGESTGQRIGSPPQLQRGDVLADRFTILRFIARGGMGEVYEAQDQVLQAHVALKTILPEHGADPEMLERLRREVLLARKASHPNVCRVYDLYSTRTPSGELLSFLTMEFLEGETLAKLLSRQGRMSVEEALPLVRQIAAGLDAAHVEGVVHRDLKASNVMLVRRPAGSAASGGLRAVITDFGIARALPGTSLVSEMKTGSGVIGTPQYMAPEQLSGGEVGPAADVYALGLMIYEMVTGALPFAGETPLEIACRRLKDPPVEPRSIVPRLDSRWNDAILRSLNPRPSERFTTAGELARALEARPGIRVGRRSWLAVLGVVGLALAIGLGATLLRRHGTAGAIRPFQARRAVALAVVPDRDLGAQAWVAPTLTALLPLELATAERSLRVIDPEDVGLAMRSLGLQDRELLSEEGRRRLGSLLGAPTVVVGSLRRLGSGQLQAVFTVPAAAGSVQASFAEQDVLEASTLLGGKLRKALGAPDPTDDAAVAAVRPRSTLAARRYGEGVDRSARSEYPAAVQAFAESAAADRTFYPAYLHQAWLLHMMGHRKQARAEAQLALEAAASLPMSAHLLSEMAIRMAEGDEAGAVRTGEQLFDQFPDDSSLAIELAMKSASREVGLGILARNRKALAGGPEPLQLQVREAWLKGELPGTELPSELYDRVEREATKLGANIELGMILLLRVYASSDRRGGVELELLDRADAAYRRAGFMEGLARVDLMRARWLMDPANPGRPPLAAGVSAYRESLAKFRRIGFTSMVNEVSIGLAHATFNVDLEGAEALLKEVEDSLRNTGEAPLKSLFGVRCWIAWRKGDLIQARQALNESRARPRSQSWWDQDDLGFVEGLLLTEEDRLDEARAVFERNVQTLRSAGWLDQALWNQNFACLTSCYQGRSEAGASCLGAVKSELDQAKAPMGRATMTWHRVRTECALEAGKLEEARTFLDEGWGPVVPVPFPTLMEILRARVDGGLGRESAAIARLREVLDLTQQRHWTLQRLDAELALGETELRMKRERGRTRLTALQAEASRMGFVRIARLAGEALGASAGPPRAR